MSIEKPSIYKYYEDATREYYGADMDMLKLVPVVTDKDVAHKVANFAESQLSRINEADIIKDALRVQVTNKRQRGARNTTDLDSIKKEVLDHKLRIAVVNTELRHASLALQDFNEDSEKAGSYEMSQGYTSPTDPTTPKA